MFQKDTSDSRNWVKNFLDPGIWKKTFRDPEIWDRSGRGNLGIILPGSGGIWEKFFRDPGMWGTFFRDMGFWDLFCDQADDVNDIPGSGNSERFYRESGIVSPPIPPTRDGKCWDFRHYRVPPYGGMPPPPPWCQLSGVLRSPPPVAAAPIWQAKICKFLQKKSFKNCRKKSWKCFYVMYFGLKRQKSITFTHYK